MAILENYLQHIQTEDYISVGGLKAGMWNIGGPDGITIKMFGDNIDLDVGDKGEEMIQAGAAIAGLVLALGIIKVSYSIYKNFINRWGRQCRGYKGVDRDSCIKKVKIKAMEIRMNALNRARDKCKIAKDPQKCVSKINSQLEKLNSKKEIMQSSLLKLKGSTQ
jgi:hypothetical protein